MSASKEQEAKDVAGVSIDWDEEFEGENLIKCRDLMLDNLSESENGAELIEILAYWLYFFSRHVYWLGAYIREPIHMRQELSAQMNAMDDMIKDFETKRKQDH